MSLGSTDPVVQKRVRLGVLVFLPIFMIVLNLFVPDLSNVAWYGNLIMALVFSLGAVAYYYDALPTWSNYALSILLSGFLLAMIFFSDTDYGLIACFIVLPTVAFISHHFVAGVIWSLVFLIIMIYVLLGSDTIPQHLFAEEVRLAFIIAYLLQSGISGTWSAIHAHNSRSLALAKARIDELERFLSMCMYCRKVKLDGSWVVVETYLKTQNQTDVSHGICPSCKEEQFAKFFDE